MSASLPLFVHSENKGVVFGCGEMTPSNLMWSQLGERIVSKGNIATAWAREPMLDIAKLPSGLTGGKRTVLEDLRFIHGVMAETHRVNIESVAREFAARAKRYGCAFDLPDPWEEPDPFDLPDMAEEASKAAFGIMMGEKGKAGLLHRVMAIILPHGFAGVRMDLNILGYDGYHCAVAENYIYRGPEFKADDLNLQYDPAREVLPITKLITPEPPSLALLPDAPEPMTVEVDLF